MPTEIFFARGDSVKVTAELGEVVAAIQVGDVLDTARFSGFRGEEIVGAERTIVHVGAIAYATAIPGP